MSRLPVEQIYIPPERRSPIKIPVCTQGIGQPGTKTLAKVRTDNCGLIEVEPIQRTLKNNSCLAGYGVAQTGQRKTFRILIASFGDKQKTLSKRHTVANAKLHPTSIQLSDIIYGELLGVIAENTTTSVE